jgi:hypothetical protein
MEWILHVFHGYYILGKRIVQLGLGNNLILLTERISQKKVSHDLIEVYFSAKTSVRITPLRLLCHH